MFSSVSVTEEVSVAGSVVVSTDVLVVSAELLNRSGLPPDWVC